MLADVDSSVKNVDGQLNRIGGKLDTALGSATTTVDNVNDVVVGLKHGGGAAGMMLQDDALASQIRQTLVNTLKPGLDALSGPSVSNLLAVCGSATNRQPRPVTLARYSIKWFKVAHSETARGSSRRCFLEIKKLNLLILCLQRNRPLTEAQLR